MAGVDLDDVLNVRNGPSPEQAVIGSILPDADGIRIVGPRIGLVPHPTSRPQWLGQQLLSETFTLILWMMLTAH